MDKFCRTSRTATCNGDLILLYICTGPATGQYKSHYGTPSSEHCPLLRLPLQRSDKQKIVARWTFLKILASTKFGIWQRMREFEGLTVFLGFDCVPVNFLYELLSLITSCILADCTRNCVKIYQEWMQLVALDYF